MSTHTLPGSLSGGVVWLLSGAALTLYGILILAKTDVSGVAQLVQYLLHIESWYIHVAAFASIVIEGLYVIGSFFPGASLVVLLAIISQAGGTGTFLATIALIYVGWLIASVLNILGAVYYGKRFGQHLPVSTLIVHDRMWATWFPAFRANYEVALIVEGYNPWAVFWSSLKVKSAATGVMLGITALLPYVIDIESISNEEGVVSIFIVAAISYVVGIVKIRRVRRGGA